ncbi:MAG TPA: aminoglycoside phosphotransferase family protein [Chloroflexota bacterium]
MSTPELDPLAVLAALGVADAERVEPATGGWSTTRVWRVERPGARLALRLFPVGWDEPARREAEAMRAAAAAGRPVPRVQVEGAWQGRPALLLDWCAGRPLLDDLRARPWAIWTLGCALGRAHARLHRVPAPPGLPGWIDWPGPPEPALRARLEAIARRDVLLHLDFHPLNVLVAGGEVAAIIDWANARAGDPRADVARTYTILVLAPPRGPTPRELLRRLLAAAYRRGYEREAAPLDGMAPFVAWAASAMLQDLRPKLGRPGIPLTEADLADLAAWAGRRL